MRICMLAYTYYENDNRVRRYADAFARRGDEVEAVAIARPGQPMFEIIDGVRVYRLQTRVIDEKGKLSYLRKLLLFFFRSAWFITRRHLAAPYDLIHVHSVPDFEVFAALLPRLLGARVILDIHDIVPEFFASKFKVPPTSLAFRLLRLVEKLSIAFADHVIISNHLWHRKLIQRSVRPEKCSTFINYPDPLIFQPAARPVVKEGPFILCYPGTINWHQGLDLAVRAMVQVRAAAPHVQFHIYGDGPHRAPVEALVHECGLQDCVLFKGLVSMKDIARVMTTVDLGVVPKRRDGFGDEAFSTKIPEFMMMGVPVIASRTSIDQYYFSPEMIQFFESENVDDLAAKILELVHDPAKREQIRTQARQFVSENNWTVKQEDYLRLVESLIKPRRRPAPAAALGGIKEEPCGDEHGS